MFVFVAIVYLFNTSLNATVVPIRYGQIVKIESLGRSWKGLFPFNIFKCEWVVRDWFTDHDNGIWQLLLTRDLDPQRRKNKNVYTYFLECIAAQTKLVQDAPSMFGTISPCVGVHRPSSLVRFIQSLQENDIGKDKEKVKNKSILHIDVKLCEQWLQEYEIKKNRQNPKSKNKNKNKNDKDTEKASK